jgi:hypothetical protein
VQTLENLLLKTISGRELVSHSIFKLEVCMLKNVHIGRSVHAQKLHETNDLGLTLQGQ